MVLRVSGDQGVPAGLLFSLEIIGDVAALGNPENSQPPSARSNATLRQAPHVVKKATSRERQFISWTKCGADEGMPIAVSIRQPIGQNLQDRGIAHIATGGIGANGY